MSPAEESSQHEAPGGDELEPTTPQTNEIPTLNLDAVAEMEERIVHALKTCYDPEIPVDIYELGLIYDIDVQPEGKVHVKMTLTSPACPVAGSLPGEVELKVQGVEGVDEASVELVWEPTWNPSMMSDAARLELGMF
jgi:FeS assembly SUF system protein